MCLECVIVRVIDEGCKCDDVALPFFRIADRGEQDDSGTELRVKVALPVTAADEMLHAGVVYTVCNMQPKIAVLRLLTVKVTMW